MQTDRADPREGVARAITGIRGKARLLGWLARASASPGVPGGDPLREHSRVSRRKDQRSRVSVARQLERTCTVEHELSAAGAALVSASRGRPWSAHAPFLSAGNPGTIG